MNHSEKRIIIDGEGGDRIPKLLPQCLKNFSEKHPQIHFLICASDLILRKIQQQLPSEALPQFEFKSCSQKISFDEAPVQALKKKKEASINLAMQAIRNEDDCLISFGPTGATAAAAQLILGRKPGIDRPGLAAILPNQTGHGILTDVGATTKCKSEHLLGFGKLSIEYAQRKLKIKSPKVGLLNVGEEPGKGDQILKKAHDLLSQQCPGFIGNVEGYQIFDGTTDIILTPGVTGNIVLKASESLADMILGRVQAGILADPEAHHTKSSLRELASRTSADSRGASCLLGVNGQVYIGHGAAGQEGLLGALNNLAKEVS